MIKTEYIDSSNYEVLSFSLRLLTSIYKTNKNINGIYINYLYNKFLLERHLYSYVYKKDKYVDNLFSIYKCKNNYIKYGNTYIEEYKALNNYFSS